MRPEIYRMQWVGGNTLFGNKWLAEQRLRSAATLDLSAPLLAENGAAAVTVRINNVGAGHMLPTGLTEVRQMWLEVTVKDAEGKALGEPKQRIFGTVLQDKSGNHPVELWDASSVFSDDRIPPKGSVEQTYSLEVPKEAASVEAALYYRTASEEIANAVGIEIPTILMVSKEQPLFASEEAKADVDKAMAKTLTKAAIG